MTAVENEKFLRFKSIDEFNLLNQLGKGGYSTVYLVENKKTKRKYALKIAPRYKDEKDRSMRTLTEIQILKKLKHPKIIGLKGYFTDDEAIYVVLEYISGKDASKIFRHKLPNKTQVKYIMRQLVESVIYCHKQGIIHRDIKLENILIDDKFNIKLIDFGLAAIKEDPNEIFSQKLGTSRLMAPEMLSPKEEDGGYNESVDIWAIGVVLFMLLTGTYPFDGSSKQNIFRRISTKTLHYSKFDLSRNEIKLLKSLLEKDPENRIEIENILDSPFFH